MSEASSVVCVNGTLTETKILVLVQSELWTDTEEVNPQGDLDSLRGGWKTDWLDP